MTQSGIVSMMAPGIMFLAASSTSPNPSNNSEKLSDQISEKSTSATATSGGSTVNTGGARADSPGYFTLSDSDGSSNPGTESPGHEDDDLPKNNARSHVDKQPSAQHIYKLFKSTQAAQQQQEQQTTNRPKSSRKSSTSSPRVSLVERNSSVSIKSSTSSTKSKTPPRPSPPKSYKRQSLNGDDPVPPRPPPPLSYTSTLPPPVPKKVKPPRPSLNNSRPTSRRLSNPPSTKPLSKVQPLQIQSPSMIKVLTGSSATERKEKSPSPPKSSPPQTFVQAFQKANNETRTRSLSREGSLAKTSTSVSSSRSSLISAKSSQSLTKTPSSRPTSRSKRSSSTCSKSSAQDSPRSSPVKETKTSLVRKASNSSLSSESSRKTSVDSKTERAIKKTSESAKKSLQSAKSFLSSKKSSSSDKAGDNLRKKKSDAKKDIGQRSTGSAKSSDGRCAKSLSSTCIDKIKEKRAKSKSLPKKVDSKEINEEKGQEKVANGKMHITNPINTLIRYYEDTQKVNGDDMSPVVLKDNASEITFDGSSRVSGHLSQLSLLSADKLNSWLSNPANDSQDLSITEIDVLDQYVTQMMSFTNDTLSDVQTPRASFSEDAFVSILEIHKKKSNDENVRQSVQDIINKIEKNSSEKKEKTTSEVKEPSVPARKKKAFTPDPSDDDLSQGVFTEVSFAGSFMGQGQTKKVEEETKAPVPSPRTKRRARKEQMLLEHKQSGREALSLLKSRSAGNVPNTLKTEDLPEKSATLSRDFSKASKIEKDKSTTVTPAETQESAVKKIVSSSSGLDCLEELCSQSANIERDIEARAVAKVSQCDGNKRDEVKCYVAVYCCSMAFFSGGGRSFSSSLSCVVFLSMCDFQSVRFFVASKIERLARCQIQCSFYVGKNATDFLFHKKWALAHTNG